MPIGLRPPAILEPEELAVKIARVRTLTVRAGRPEDAVSVCFSTEVLFQDTPSLSRRMMSGRPEQIAADLRQYQDSQTGQREAMERFSRQVMPLIPQV